MAGIGPGYCTEQRSPVFAAPVLRLPLGAYADGYERLAVCGAQGLSSSCLFSGSQEKFPTGGRFKVGVTQLGQIAGETGGLRFEDLAGFLAAVLLHIWRERNAYQVPYPAEAEEGGVTAGGFDAARGSEVDEDFGAPSQQLPPQGGEIAQAACAGCVAEESVDQIGVVQDSRCRRSLYVDREVGQHAAFGVGEGTRDQMERWESYDGVTEAAEAID